MILGLHTHIYLHMIGSSGYELAYMLRIVPGGWGPGYLSTRELHFEFK